MRWRRGGEGLREECLYGVFMMEGGEENRSRGEFQHLKKGGRGDKREGSGREGEDKTFSISRR